MVSPVDTSVKNFNERQYGVPPLTGEIGKLTTLFDALFKNGFGTQNVTSIVVSGGIATVTLPTQAANPECLDSVQLFAGATGAWTDLNGEQKILSATETTVTFATALGNGTATGTITMKFAPLGIDILFTGTNQRAYKVVDVASPTKPILQMDDSVSGGYANVRMYETMSSLTAGTNQSPTTSASAGSLWCKSMASNSTPIPWDLFGDSRAVIFCPRCGIASSSAYVSQGAYFFGDLVPNRSADAWASWLTLHASYTSTAQGSVFNGGQGAVASRVLRAFTGLGASVWAAAYPFGGATNAYSGGDVLWGSYPSIDGKSRLTEILVVEGAVPGQGGVTLRGKVPGALYVPQNGGAAGIGRGTKITIDGRRYASVLTGSSFSVALDAAGWGLVDTTGPWRT